MKRSIHQNHIVAFVWFLVMTIPVYSQNKALVSDTAKVVTGQQIYANNCLSCHQANGGGVPMIAPPLSKISYVLGDKEQLINIVINGFNEDVEIAGEYYSNPMPAFPHLSDEAIAKVLTYIRSNFGNNAGPVTRKEVTAARAKITAEN